MGINAELDTTIGYSKQLGELQLTFEHTNLLFFDENDVIPDTAEVRGRVDWSRRLVPTYLLLKYDYAANDFIYTEIGALKRFELTNAISFAPSRSAGRAICVKNKSRSQSQL